MEMNLITLGGLVLIGIGLAVIASELFRAAARRSIERSYRAAELQRIKNVRAFARGVNLDIRN